MQLTNNQYNRMVKAASPPTAHLRTMVTAFLVGGAICTLGQALINLYIHLGAEKDNAFAGASITLIFLGALLTGLNIYDDISKIGGAGALVPITGFANAVTAPALEYKTEGYIMGVGAKLFSIAGPVIVYGLSAGVLYGFIIYLLKL
ncbi:MAG: stage V sporulation protein AC [Oscillospiraceae bacterium]|nr:stage V sporulation protein AC [Oscillospiraceae bacterium]